MDPARIIRAPFLILIRMYQAVHGAFFHGVCRFHPTCSHYALEAIETRGVGMGLLLSAWRILRCQPFCRGGYDPVPGGRSDRDGRGGRLAEPSVRHRLSLRRIP